MYSLYTGAIDHQASFIKRELALRHPYDEKYKIVSDWKFFIQALILDNCSFFYTPIIVVKVDMNGISNTQTDIDKQERIAVLKELFPQRILYDYNFLASIHPELLKLVSRISKSHKILFIVQKLIKPLLKLKGV